MVHDKLFLALLGANSAHSEVRRRMFTELNLMEGHPKILYLLRRHDGIVQKELAELCMIKQSTLTVLLAKMEELDFVRRETCYVSGNKRAYKVCLTEAGKAKAEELEIEIDKLEKRALKGFSEEEKWTLLRWLAKVEDNMKA